jgi:hypothetical protein
MTEDQNPLDQSHQVPSSVRRSWRTSIIAVLVGIGTIIGYFFVPVLPQSDRVWFSIVLGTLLLSVLLTLGLAELIAIKKEQTIQKELTGRLSSATDNLRTLLSDVRQESASGTLFKTRIRNVSLRVSTIHQIINDLVHAVPASERDDILRKIGSSIGTSWSQDLVNQFYLVTNQNASEDNLEDILRLWADYDASAGMGRFDFSNFDITNYHGEIVLENSFLSRAPSDWPLNELIAGYLQGSLQALTGAPISVRLLNYTTDVLPKTRFAVSC